MAQPPAHRTESGTDAPSGTDAEADSVDTDDAADELGGNESRAPSSETPPPLLATVSDDVVGLRLDAVAAQLFPMHSRNRLQGWIADGRLTVDGRVRKVREKLFGGERIRLELPAGAEADLSSEAWGDAPAEAIELAVVHEDDAILVINKPAGLVMHPAPGNRTGTLVNALLHHDPRLREVPRAGIVHRLDKETSGLCVVAKTLVAHTHLVRQLQAREMGREYLAVVLGDPAGQGTLDAPIARHPKDRKRMAVVDGGRHAVTHFRVLERYDGCALLAVRLETGRTHQIRVHMTHIGYSLIGDPVYGRRLAVLPRQVATVPAVVEFKRQALHATKLSLVHPDSEERVTFDAPMPTDLELLCKSLRVTRDQALREASES